MKMLIIFCAIIALASCAKPYYGYSEQEWHALSFPEQQAVIKEYQPILEAKRAQQHSDEIARQKETLLDLGISKAGR